MLKFRPTIRFSLRTMLVAVTVAGILAGWTAWQYRIVNARRTFWPRFNDHNFSVRTIGMPGSPRPHIPWLRQLLGDFAESNLVYNPRQDPHGEQLRQVRELFPEAKIWGWPGDRSLPAGIEPLADGQYYRI